VPEKTIDIPDLAGQTWLITGATSGVGLETARAASRVGARVILAVRDTERGRQVAAQLPGETRVVEVDLHHPGFTGQLRRHLPPALGVTDGEDHPRSYPGRRPGRLQPDPARRAGDEPGLAGEVRDVDRLLRHRRSLRLIFPGGGRHQERHLPTIRPPHPPSRENSRMRARYPLLSRPLLNETASRPSG